jgi:Protein of unknown function (DUF2470)
MNEHSIIVPGSWRSSQCDGRTYYHVSTLQRYVSSSHALTSHPLLSIRSSCIILIIITMPPTPSNRTASSYSPASSHQPDKGSDNNDVAAVAATSHQEEAKAESFVDDPVVMLEEDLRRIEPRILRHMNEDHPDSLRAYVLAFGTPTVESRGCQSAVLTGLDSRGFVLEIVTTTTATSSTTMPPSVTTTATVRVPYDRPPRTAGDLHGTAVRMHTMAYSKLGFWYKIRTGYYNKAVRLMGNEMNKILGKAKATETIRTVATNATLLSLLLLGGATAAAILAYHGYSNGRHKQQPLLLKR